MAGSVADSPALKKKSTTHTRARDTTHQGRRENGTTFSIDERWIAAGCALLPLSLSLDPGESESCEKFGKRQRQLRTTIHTIFPHNTLERQHFGVGLELASAKTPTLYSAIDCMQFFE